MTEPVPSSPQGLGHPPPGDQEHRALQAEMLAEGVPLGATEDGHLVSLFPGRAPLSPSGWFLWIDHPRSWSYEGSSHWEYLGTADEAVARARGFFGSTRGLAIMRELREGTYKGNCPADALGLTARPGGLEPGM